MTRTWCDDPERLMEQERRYLDVLSRVSQIYGDRLSLHTEDDEALLFQAEDKAALRSPLAGRVLWLAAMC